MRSSQLLLAEVIGDGCVHSNYVEKPRGLKLATVVGISRESDSSRTRGGLVWSGGPNPEGSMYESYPERHHESSSIPGRA